MAAGWQELNSAALMAARSSDNAKAEQLWIRSLEQLQKRGQEDENALLVLDNLARHYVRVGAYGSAERYMRHIVEVSRRVEGPDSPAVAKSLVDLSDLCSMEGREDDALPLLEEALKIWEVRLGPAHFEVARCLRRMATIAKVAARYADAEALLRRALPIYERSFESRHAEIARLYNDLALVCMYQEKYDVAEKLFLREFEIWKSATRSKRPDIAKSLNDLAIFYHNRNERTKAEKAARKAIDLSIGAMGPKNLQAARGNNIVGICQATAGDLEAALDSFQTALGIIQDIHGEEHPLTKELWDNITRTTSALKKR